MRFSLQGKKPSCPTDFFFLNTAIYSQRSNEMHLQIEQFGFDFCSSNLREAKLI